MANSQGQVGRWNYTPHTSFLKRHHEGVTAALATFGSLSTSHKLNSTIYSNRLTGRMWAGLLRTPELTGRKGQRTPGSGAGLLGSNPDSVTCRLCNLCFGSLGLLHLSDQGPPHQRMKTN